MNPKLNWTLKKFDDLTSVELYKILQLRSEVFVVEQQSLFLDMDGKDLACEHLCGTLNGELLAYSRIVPAGLSYVYPSIGRIVVSRKGRGMGLGRELLLSSISVLERRLGKTTIRIGAQLYLKDFYRAFGFQQTSEVYDEDGIEHIEMTRSSEPEVVE